MTEEHCTCDETLETIKSMMFICGGQTDSDGDFLPESFTVFSRLTQPDEAVAAVMEKIVDDVLAKEMLMSTGSLAFIPITSWQEWCDVEGVDDHTKMTALSVAIATGYLGSLAEATEKITDLITLPWVPGTL